MEAIMSIVNEAAPNQTHVGAACSNPKNQVFTVIGYADQPYSTNKNSPSRLACSLEFDPAGAKSYVYGLYYDANAPERQGIISCRAREVQVVRDINDVRLLNAAMKSPFYNPELIRHFVQILQGNVTCDLPFTQSLLRGYIIRGFDNMVQILHSKYITLLKEAGVGKDLVSLIVQGASQEVTRPKGAVRTTLTQSEIKLDQMRMRALTSDSSSLRKSTLHSLYFGNDRESALLVLQEDKKVKCLRVATCSYIGFEEATLKATKKLPLKVSRQINVGAASQKVLLVLDSESMMNMASKEVRDVVKTANFVLTDDGFSLATFVAKIEPMVEEDKTLAQLAKTAFVLVSKDALDGILNSVSSQEDGLVESTNADYSKGMLTDALTEAIAKITSEGIKAVTN